MMEAFALALQEPIDPGRVVGGLDELDLRLPYPEEGDADAVVRHVGDRLQVHPEGVPPQDERLIERAHDQCDMVDLSQPADPFREARLARWRWRHDSSVPSRRDH